MICYETIVVLASFQVNVSTNVIGAAIYVDGSYIGLTGEDYKLAIPNITEGEHLFIAKKEGYMDMQKKWNITSNTVLNLYLEPIEKDVMISGYIRDYNYGVNLKGVEVEFKSPEKVSTTYTGSAYSFVISEKYLNNSKVKAILRYHPNKDGSVSFWIKNNTDPNPLFHTKSYPYPTSVDFMLDRNNGGGVYYGLQLSHDYWTERNESKSADVKINVPTSCNGANTACNYGDNNNDGVYDIDFTTNYQFADVAAHEWGHSISREWNLPKEHCTNFPLEEAWANFASALARNNPKFEKYSVDLTTEKPGTCIDNNKEAKPDNEWALAGVMWDLEKLSPGVVYDVLSSTNKEIKKSTITELKDSFVTKFQRDGLPVEKVCTTFNSHGFNICG